MMERSEWHIRCVSLILLFCSCEKFFHTEETSIGIIDNYDELVTAVEGVYGQLNAAFNGVNVQSFYNPNLKGDDLHDGLPYYEYYYGGDCPDIIYTPDVDYIRRQADLYRSLYRVIVSANNILIQFCDLSHSDSPKCKILGEVYLLRAYCYFRLTRTYAQIPLITDIEIDYQVEKASLDSIYAFIESDLLKAADLLPGNAADARRMYATPHRGCAKGLLAELYLHWAGYPVKDAVKYNEAFRVAGEVIDSAEYFRLGLLPDFARLWQKGNGTNEESELCLYFADPLNMTDADPVNTVYLGRIETDFPYLLHTEPNSYGIWQWFFASGINFYNVFPGGYRKDITYYSTIYVANEYPYYPAIDTGYIYIDTATFCARPGYRKLFYEPTEAPDLQLYGLDLPFTLFCGNTHAYLYRFAHTLLTYAEAKARSGQLDASAYEAVNRVRRRAHNFDQYATSPFDLTPGLSPEAFADSVVWERAWEFAGEPEGRWFDLVRLEKVEELEQLRSPDDFGPPDFPITKDDYFSPIPVNDQFLNPNLGKK
jgi:starch-binding outer membrane protein, SusD/RagB family